MKLFKVLGILVSLVLLVGFGVCGVGGVVAGFAAVIRNGDAVAFIFLLICGGTGIGIAYGCYLLIRQAVKDLRS